MKHSSKWIIKEFIKEHCHTLASPKHVQFLRSNKVVSGGDLQMARNMKSTGISTCHIMSFMTQRSDGYEKIKYIIKDLYNHIGEAKSCL